MKQKILSGILAGVMAFTVIPMAVGAADMEPKITFSDATYTKVGDEVEITVSIENNPGFVSATIPVQWDEEKLVLKRIDNTDMIEDLLADNVDPQGFYSKEGEKICGWLGREIPEEGNDSGLYHLAWNYDTMYAGNYEELEFTGNGPLCVMVFEVREDITKSSTIFSADTEGVFRNVMDWNMNDLAKNEVTGVTLSFGEGMVKLAESPTKPEGLLGDISGDQKINIIDVDTLFRHVMKFDTKEWSEEQIYRADVNKDNKVNIIDVDKLFRYVMKYDKTLE